MKLLIFVLVSMIGSTATATVYECSSSYDEEINFRIDFNSDDGPSVFKRAKSNEEWRPLFEKMHSHHEKHMEVLYTHVEDLSPIDWNKVEGCVGSRGDTHHFYINERTDFGFLEFESNHEYRPTPECADQDDELQESESMDLACQKVEE